MSKSTFNSFRAFSPLLLLAFIDFSRPFVAGQSTARFVNFRLVCCTFAFSSHFWWLYPTHLHFLLDNSHLRGCSPSFVVLRTLNKLLQPSFKAFLFNWLFGLSTLSQSVHFGQKHLVAIRIHYISMCGIVLSVRMFLHDLEIIDLTLPLIFSQLKLTLNQPFNPWVLLLLTVETLNFALIFFT